jgi:hypothetical protein
MGRQRQLRNHGYIVGGACYVRITILLCVVLLLSDILFLGSVQRVAHATSGYACNDDPCAEARIDYVERWVRRACALARALEAQINRRIRAQNTVDNLQARLNQCLLRHVRRPRLCNDLRRRLQRATQNVRYRQQIVDRTVARLRSSCNASLPNGVPGNPPCCEEKEAMNYCPIVNEQQALASIQARCADLKAEQQDQALCGVCIDPNAPVAAASLARGGWNALAERPTCPRPSVIGDVPVEATSAPVPGIASPVPQITAPPVTPTLVAPLQTVAVPQEEVSVAD